MKNITSATKDNIHHDVAGEDILGKQDIKFKEYRKRWTENPQKLDHGKFPLHLDIEVTSACNLKCPFCATTYSSFDDGLMKWNTFKKVIDEASEMGLYACKFNFRGEPLLHKQLGKFISYAKKKGLIDVFFNTNAVLLTEDNARMLIESGLDRLTVSFEGFEKENYEKSRVGANFEQVVANVENLRNIREKIGADNPKIRVQAVMIPELEGRLDEYVDFWKDKVDQVSYNDMEPSVDSVKRLLEEVKTDWICPFPYQRMTIMWDGNVVACKNDYFGKLSLGNVNEISLSEAWNKNLENLRKLHREGLSHTIEACCECPLRYSELIKLGVVEDASSF